VRLPKEKGQRRPRGEGYNRAAKLEKEPEMTLCPVALAVGCEKCPLFKVCPAKAIIGDQKKEAPGDD
jgi:formate hydrogenlyase subunit 6/NADH:ubiquinone oxidoreductase subunit I